MRCSTRCELEDIACDEGETFEAVESRRTAFRLRSVRDIVEQLGGTAFCVGLALEKKRKTLT